MTPHQRALQVGVTDPHFQMPTQLDAMEAQMRADLLNEKVLPDPILTLAYQKKVTTVSQILVLVFHQYSVTRPSAMEQPLRPSKTFEDAAATLRTWQSKLRIVLHDLNARPEPLRLCNSVLPLTDSLTLISHTAFPFLTRSTRVRTECVHLHLRGLPTSLPLSRTSNCSTRTS